MALYLVLPWWANTRKKHSPNHTYPDHQPSFISSLHLLRSIASFQFILHAWQSFCTTSLQVLFGLSLGLEPSASYSVHFFFFATHAHTVKACFAVNSKIMLSIPSLFCLNVTHLSDHSHLCLLKCHLTFFPYRPGPTSMQHTTSHTTAVQSLSSKY